MEKNGEMTNTYGTFIGPLLRLENEKSPWLIFLHGFPDDSSAWSFQIEALKDQYQIWAPDLYSHPFSEQVNGVAEFLKEIRSDAEVFIISHDLGGPVACEIARLFPERVSKLLLINTLSLGLFLGRWKNPRQWMKSCYMTLFTGPMHATGWWSKLGRIFLKTAYDLGLLDKQDPLRKNATDVLEGIKRYREIAKAILTIAKLKDQKIKCEGHFLFGTRDAFLLAPKDNELKDHFQKYSIQTVEAGHWPQRTHATQVIDWIKRTVSKAA